MHPFRLITITLLGCHAAFAGMESTSWISPDKKLQVELSYPAPDKSPKLTAGPLGKPVAVEESPFLKSPISREFGGITWFQETAPRWLENRCLIFEVQDRLAVIDVEHHTLPLCTAFEAKEKSPKGDVWAAIRYRAYSRKGTDPALPADTLLLIDLPKVIKLASSPPVDAVPYQHLESLKLPGRALAKPTWIGTEQHMLVIPIWDGKSLTAVLITTAPLKIVAHRELKMNLPSTVIEHKWITPEAEPELIRAAQKAMSPVE